MTRKIELHFLSSDREPVLFDTVEEVIDELRRYICDDCMDGWTEYYEPFLDKYDVKTQKLYYLLSTSCGCEFDVKYEDQDWDDVYAPVYDS